jgi:hypothetical protein
MRHAKAHPFSAWISGVISGGVMAVIAALAAPRPANELVLPQLAIEPISLAIAGALAAAVPSYRLRASMAPVLALALGGAFFVYMCVWAVHWISVGPVTWSELVWRRDLAAAFVGIIVASSVSTITGSFL